MITFLFFGIAPVAILNLCFGIEVFVGLIPLQSQRLPARPPARAIIIVPAHDEALILEQKLPKLIRAAGHRTKILLVADNCIDATAVIARQCGVNVIERFDSEHRGKGFALDFACHHLRTQPPDVVLIIDADCETDEQSISLLIATCAATGSPCQSTNLQLAEAGASPVVQLSTFAFYIKNVVRQRGLFRLSGRAQLLGTGMALPWSLFVHANLATSDIVEDLKLGQSLAEAGHEPVFIEKAVIWSKAETGAGTISQRSRWEGGFLENAFRAGPQMLARSFQQAEPRLFWAGLHTMIPPFALLALLNIGLFLFVASLSWLTTASRVPLLFLGGTLLAALLSLGLAWSLGGRRFVSVRSLFLAPFYVAWKVPMYVRLARRGAPKEWTRTSRN